MNEGSLVRLRILAVFITDMLKRRPQGVESKTITTLMFKISI